MNIKITFRYWLFLMALLIISASLFFTNRIVKKLTAEERQKMEIWAEATRRLVSEPYSDFIFEIVENNEDIPVIVIDEHDNYISSRNLGKIKGDTTEFYQKKIRRLKTKNKPIIISIDKNERQYIYYDDSILLKQLAYFPYVQLSLIAIFLIVSLWAFSADKKSEQNKVWVGLSKETAHQLGTPISSLSAWVEIIKEKYKEDEAIAEMDEDIKRLTTIAERFSKIGSTPELKETDLVEMLNHAIVYMKNRSSKKVQYITHFPPYNIQKPLNRPLFEWVIENLSKNAMDAMGGEGSLTYSVKKENEKVIIDISDTGKGIERKNFKTVFKPGFTTKKRGWGLGLSLAKRIIEEYHGGKIFVKSSEIGKGTTFRIIL